MIKLKAIHEAYIQNAIDTEVENLREGLVHWSVSPVDNVILILTSMREYVFEITKDEPYGWFNDQEELDGAWTFYLMFDRFSKAQMREFKDYIILKADI